MDPVTQEVVRYRLSAIADEMETALLRAAYSAIVKEGLDASAAVFDRSGDNVAQAAAIPIHLGCMIPSVRSVLERWPAETMRPGDVFILNDPYAGGTHLPDIAVLRPLFHGADMVGIAATMSHHQEIGGMVPGSLPPNATELYQEGLRLPPMKLFDAGEPVTPIFDMIRANVRTPDVVLGDLRAQLAACHLAEDRMRELVDEVGLTVLEEVMAALLDRSERLTRARVAEIPDGAYTFTDFMDDDGVDIGRPVEIRATVTVAGSDLHVDFTGTAPQAKGPYNCVPASSIAAVYYVLRAVTGPDIPNNSGCYRGVKITLPPGSLVNPHEPAPVNSRTATVLRLCDALFGCFAQAVPDRMPAAQSGQLLVMNFGGTDPATGRTYVTSEIGMGGMAARPGLDGVDAVEASASNCMNVPAEAIEMESPVRVLSWRIWADSGGAGRWRGGCGTEKVFTLTAGSASANYRGERHTTHAWGLRGGLGAPFSHGDVERADGTAESLPSKTMVHLREGDRLRVRLSGGGGYGDPHTRPAEDVARDVRDRRVTRDAARDLYGVVVTGDGDVDAAATERARSSAARHDREDLEDKERDA
ncbi:hydantoinase B/oxoprolinase family protein [Actinomadura rugatobispora]|uniref:Hydantoinase B/oxoprolinase family protein n=1 Tax=Actinomadura rugatobispora TaxID=1994 RepID=A0ABW1A986_9ACTN|nr:hydantoinase B/oxoprolinase family protein [Actinomadura rugatobispora]